MPPKKARTRQASASPASTGQGAAGGLSGHASPGDPGQSSSFISPSQHSESSPSPEKAVWRGQNATRRGLDVGTEGSWQGKSAVGALNFAQVSSGRAAPGQLPLVEKRQKSVGRNTAPAVPSVLQAGAARNAVSAPLQRAKTVAVRTTAADIPGDDQQTQDAAGQDAAPRMRFQVRRDACHVDREVVCSVHAARFVCICTMCENDWCGAARVCACMCSAGCLPWTAH